MNIVMNVIPHKRQRYNTVGDWQVNHTADTLIFNISFLGDWKMEACLFIHEYVEAVRCLADGVTMESVDIWDLNFKGEGEPGDDPKAPYHKQHVEASKVERVLARQLGVNWQEYENKLEEKYNEYEAEAERQRQANPGSSEQSVAGY